MKKADAFQPFSAIKKQLDQIAMSLGLTLETFAIVMNDDLDFCDIQCSFSIRPEAVMSDAEREQAAFDHQFEQIERDEREKELRDKKIPKMEADINEWLEED